jgi:hypothetical protein
MAAVGRWASDQGEQIGGNGRAVGWRNLDTIWCTKALEKIQKDLQAESACLVGLLEEECLKIVDLSNEKVELMLEPWSGGHKVWGDKWQCCDE